MEWFPGLLEKLKQEVSALKTLTPPGEDYPLFSPNTSVAVQQIGSESGAMTILIFQDSKGWLRAGIIGEFDGLIKFPILEDGNVRAVFGSPLATLCHGCWCQHCEVSAA
jgi:hypothetical protein